MNLHGSIRFLSRELFKLTGVPAIILIDEYEDTMNSAFYSGDQRYESMKNCMSHFFTDTLEENQSLARSYITGVNRLSKADILSGINNLTEYGVDSTIFKSSFGFTSQEVRSLVDTYYRRKFP